MATFSYDPTGLGNLIQKTITGRSESDPSAAQLTDSYTYRADGKMTAFESQRGSASGSGSGSDQSELSATYSFDALGRRVAKQLAFGKHLFTHSYVYLGLQDQILLGKSADSTVVLYEDRLGAGAGIDEHLGELSAPLGGKAYVSDHLGSILNSDASNGAEVFDAWGRSPAGRPEWADGRKYYFR